MQLEMKSKVQLRWRLAVACAVLFWFAGLVSVGVDDYALVHDDLIFSEDTSVSSTSTDSASRVSDANEASNSFVHSANKHSTDLFLMGRPKLEPETVVEVENLTETRLDFVLRGVFASEGSRLGGAVIDVGSKEPGFFQIGDLIAEDITLAAVQDDGVVIDRAGKREKLSFDQSLLGVDSFVRSRNSDFSSAQVQEADLATDPKAKKRRLSLTERLKILRSN